MDALIIALAVGAIAWAGFQSIQLGSGGAFQHWQASLRRHQESDLHRSGVATQLNKFFHEFRRHRKPALTWRSLAVADIIQESPDTKSFLLVDPSGDRLPSFAPGQHLLVESPSGPLPTLRRCYSLSHGPGKGYYQFTVKKKAVGSVESSLSTRLHQQLAIGDLIRVKGPQGTFTSDAIGKTPVVLIAAGVGITPMISMLEGILEKQPNASVWLFYQVRDAEHEIFGSKLRKISQKYTQFQLRIFHSRSAENAIGDEVTFRGKFGVGHIHHEIRSLAPHFFMCGPEEWMRQMSEGLKTIGHPEDRIHFESFGEENHASPRTSQDGTPSSAVHSVTFRQSKTTVACSSEDLLSVAKQAKANVESGCRTGNCGSCVTRLLQGAIRYRREPQCDVDQQQIALCIAEPTSDIVLDA